MRPENTRTAYRTCPICEATCGLEIGIEGDRVVRIRGDKDDAFSKGFFCPKGAALGELQDDPDRLRRPLIKCNGEFKEASWSDAFKEAEKGLTAIMKQGDRDALALYVGNPCAHTLSGMLYLPLLLHSVQSRNLYSAATIDQMPRHAASGLMFGSPTLLAIPDLDRTQYLMILGANPLVSGGSLCTAPGFPNRLKAIQKRAGKVVVIDPAKTQTAKAADEHHSIRPGTDAWFLLGLTHVLFREELVSLKHVTNFVEGLDEVRELALRFSPERAALNCGIEAETIRRLARELSASPAAAVYGRLGTNANSLGTLNAWLIDVINILTGNLDKAGGMMFPVPGHRGPFMGPGGKGWQIGRWRSRVKGYPEVMGEFPIATLADEIERPGEGQVRGLLTIAGNPVVSSPDAARLDRALAALDFMVSVDFYLNETTRHAHVILPPPGPLSTGHSDIFIYNNAVRNIAHYSPPVFVMDADHPDKWEIILKLIMILNGQGADADPIAFDDLAFGLIVQRAVKNAHSSVAGRDPEELIRALGGRKGPERILDFMLRTGQYGEAFGTKPGGLSLDKLISNPHGIDLGPIEPAMPQAIRTPSGKIQLAPPPIIEDARRLDEISNDDREDLVLIGRRHVRSCNSWMHNLPSLRRGDNRCTLIMNPADAQRLGLAHGNHARVSSSVGSIVAPVEVSDDIMLGVVSLPHGWGHNAPDIRMSIAKKNAGVNSNIVSEGNIDPLSGNAVLNAIPVNVIPVAES